MSKCRSFDWGDLCPNLYQTSIVMVSLISGLHIRRQVVVSIYTYLCQLATPTPAAYTQQVSVWCSLVTRLDTSVRW